MRTSWVRVWNRLAVVPVLLWLAGRDLARGRRARAKSRFLRCADLLPDSFGAHFGLASIYLHERDYRRARRELLLAQEISPAQFRRRRESLPRVAGALDEIEIPGAVARYPLVATLGRPEPLAEAPVNLGDCASLEEYQRFQAMGPITVDERRNTDLARLLARLTGDDS